MKTLIVGGNGFIGSHLVDSFVAQRREAVVLDLYERRYDPMPSAVRFIRGDLNQGYLVREALIGVDVVVHLAWATIHETSNEDPASDVIANLVPTLRLIDAAIQAGVKRFVFTSSGGTVYGPARALPVREDHPENPINAYGINKLAVEKYLQMFRHLSGLDFAVLRPSVPYGPRQNPLGRQGAVAVFLHRVANGLPLDIWGNGEITRDYFHVSDLVSALIAAADADLDGERVFNIGGSEGVSLNRLVACVEETVGKKAQIRNHPARGFDVPELVLETSRAAEILGWSPSVPMKEGLRDTWEWMSKTFKK